MVETLLRSHSLDTYIANPSSNHRGTFSLPLNALPTKIWVNSCIKTFLKSILPLVVALGDFTIMRFKLGYATPIDQEGISPLGWIS